MLSDLERQIYGEIVLSFSFGGANITNAATIQACWLNPFTGFITEVSCGYGTEAGTSPSITVFTLKRASTTICTLPAITTDSTPITSGEVSLFVSHNDIMTISLTGNHATDNDFLGLTALVRMQRPLSSS